jgi:hypothetical protein
MFRSSRLLALFASLVFCAAAHAQALTGSPQQVSLLGPQLVQFTGSQTNFEAIVNGLTQGIPVTITTTDAGGNLQIVTFTPQGTLTPTDAARVIENARNTLITRGVAAPNAQQIAVALVGGSLTTPTGTAPVTGAIPGATGTTLVQVRTEVTAVPNTLTGINTITGNNLQALRANLAQTGLSTFEVNQALQLAGVILAQNGIVAPTAEQLQIALVGGNLLLPNGTAVPVQGVLQGRLPASGIPTAATTTGFPTAGSVPPNLPSTSATSSGFQATTPTAPTAGTPQFGTGSSTAGNAAASAGSTGGAAGFRATR